MPQSVGQVALDIVMGKNTVSGVVKDAMSECTRIIGDSSASMSSKIGAVGSACTSIGAAITPASVAVAGLGVGMMKSAMTFEDGMAKISTLVDTGVVDMEKMKSSIVDLSNQTGVSTSEITEATYSAISAGVDAADAVEFVGDATKLAQAGFTDTNSALSVLTTSMNAYGYSAEDMSKVSDSLIQVQNRGVTTIGELSGVMGRAIATGSSYGVSLENIESAYISMTKQGMDTSYATTYLSGMIRELGDSGSTVGQILQEKTGQSFGQLMESGVSLGDVLEILNQSVDGNAEAMAQLWGSGEAAMASSSLMAQGVDYFNESLDVCSNSLGATDEAFEKTQTSSWDLQRVAEQLHNSFTDLGGVLMDTLGPVIGQICDAVAEFTTWFAGLDDGTKEIIVKIGLLVAVAGPLLIVFGSITSAVGSIIGTFSSLGTGIGGLVSKFAGLGSASSSMSTLGSAASSASAPVSSAGSAVGGLAKNAVGFIALGAGILLAAAGISLLAYSAIQLAEAGAPAAIAMGAMVAVIALLAVGAAALGPPLTAGAVGLIAFGAAVALVGVGVLAASTGMTLLASQLPTISEYGLSASVAILALSVAITAFGAGALVGGAGATVLGVGLVACSVGALAFSVSLVAVTVGIAALAVGLTVLSVGVGLLSVGLAACAASLVIVTSTATMLILQTTLLSAGEAKFTAAVLANTVAAVANTAAYTLNTTFVLACSVAVLANTVAILANSVSVGAATLIVVAYTVAVVAFTVATAAATVTVLAMSVAVNALHGSVRTSSNGINSVVTNLIGNIVSRATNAGNNLRNGVQNVIGNIGGTIQNGLNNAVSFITGLGGRAYQWGTDMLAGMAQGIWDSIDGIIDAAAGVADTIAEYLHFSCPDVGPLSEYEEWMPDFMQGMASGIEGNTGLVTGALDDLTKDMTVNPALTVTPPALKNSSPSAQATESGRSKIDELIELLLEWMKNRPDPENGDGGDWTFPIYIGSDLLDDYIISQQDRRMIRSGGRA